MAKENVQVNLQPVGRRIEAPIGTTILEAAREAGVELVAICGGEGVCGSCRVRPIDGEFSPISSTENDILSSEQQAAGYRLACETKLLSNARVDIPIESLTTPQRLQLEGSALQVELDPVILPQDIHIEPPTLGDLRSDLTRLRAALPDPEAVISYPVLKQISGMLRQNQWQVRLALRGDHIVAILPSQTAFCGLAVDVGTTKIAAYLVDLENGETLAKSGAMNPQIAYGEDVISRIHYTNQHSDGARRLQAKLVAVLNELIAGLCQVAQVAEAQIVEAVIVGNTAMHHLLTGLPVKQLGESPYVAAISESLQLPAAALDLNLSAGASIYLPPNIAGYVGADHTAMLLGAQLQNKEKTTLALDIGTNTEISLIYKGKHWSCSCASGPAFEGAHIEDGMRAAPGAIEHVHIQGDHVRSQTIEGKPATGICGSGILDAVAELSRSGLLDQRGNFRGQHPNLEGKGSQAFFLLTHPEDSRNRRVKITRKDINEIQLAKGAIRTGIDILLMEAGIQADEIEQFIVAGAFGTYLDLESTVRIGMFPDLPRERFRQVGNAAGDGARHLLVSKQMRKVAAQIAENVIYVELANHPDFMKVYVKALEI